MKGRHRRPQHWLVRLKVAVARVLAAELPTHPDPAATASTTRTEATVTDGALAKADPRQTPPHQD